MVNWVEAGTVQAQEALTTAIVLIKLLILRAICYRRGRTNPELLLLRSEDLNTEVEPGWVGLGSECATAWRSGI